jgi:hypothetical protein
MPFTYLAKNNAIPGDRHGKAEIVPSSGYGAAHAGGRITRMVLFGR